MKATIDAYNFDGQISFGDFEARLGHDEGYAARDLVGSFLQRNPSQNEHAVHLASLGPDAHSPANVGVITRNSATELLEELVRTYPRPTNEPLWLLGEHGSTFLEIARAVVAAHDWRKPYGMPEIGPTYGHSAYFVVQSLARHVVGVRRDMGAFADRALNVRRLPADSDTRSGKKLLRDAGPGSVVSFRTHTETPVPAVSITAETAVTIR